MNKKVCGQECEVYSRCCGYFRPVKAWNIGKREEFLDRKKYDVNKYINKDQEQKE